MINNFLIDCENFDGSKIESAMEGFVQSDVPLLIEVIFVDEEEIQRLNREQRKIDRITDVLSFPSMEDICGKELKKKEHVDEIDEEGRLFIGSVVICEKRAIEQAQEYGHSYRRELHYLIVHGIMHCLGYDHIKEEDKVIMREKEELILGKMGITREE